MSTGEAHVDERDQGVPGKWLILLMAQIGVFMCTFDTGVVNLALPVISEQFGTSLATIKWVAVIYTGTAALALPTAAFLGRRFGVCRVYMIGQVLFTVGSVSCGLAQDLDVLVALRFVAALGASIILALNQVIMLSAFPKHQHGRALGFSGTTFALGILVGLAAGGILIHLWGWRSIFLINLPFGIVMIGLGLRVMKAQELGLDKTEALGFDWKGMVLTGAALGSLVLLVSQLLGHGHASAWVDAGMVGFAALALFAWLRHELRDSESFLNLQLLKTSPLAFNFTNAFTVRVIMGSVTFIIPFYLQYTLDLTPFHAGLALSAGAVAMGIFGPFAGAWADKYGMQHLARIGVTTMAVALCALAFLPPSVTTSTLVSVLALVIVAQFINGTGSVSFSAANTSACLHSVVPRYWGAISSLQSVTLMAGTALGSTIAADLVSFWGSQDQGAARAADAVGKAFPPNALALLFGGGAFALAVLATAGWMRKATTPQAEAETT